MKLEEAVKYYAGIAGFFQTKINKGYRTMYSAQRAPVSRGTSTTAKGYNSGKRTVKAGSPEEDVTTRPG